ncbi:hypothetical protein D3C72_2082490 [compost metagenome]
MPTYCQTEISDTAISAEPGRPSHGANSDFRPTRSSIQGATPQIGDRISFQMKPTMTKESSVGRKIAVR